jgi:prepilin-type N-terminal cleavage/methylation domain-containing protein
MKKQGFTLIELLISIILFGLIAVLLFGTLDNMRHQLTFLQSKSATIDTKNTILSLMRSDFDRPKSLTLTHSLSKEFTVASLTGSNRSLYDNSLPYVTWLVLKKNNTLVRLESVYPITLPLQPEMLYKIHSDVIATGCEIFRIYEEPKHRLLYLKLSNQAPLVVQVAR